MSMTVAGCPGDWLTRFRIKDTKLLYCAIVRGTFMIKRTAAKVAVLLLFFCFSPSSEAKDRLAVGYTSASGVFAGLWIAQEAKLFDKYNIDSHLILIASGSLMVQSMLGGDLPISAAAGSASVDAALAGSD